MHNETGSAQQRFIAHHDYTMPSLTRIKPPSRPLRPPSSKAYRATRARFFARNPHLHILASANPRPQLSFLTAARHHPTIPSTFFSRLITTETRNYIKHQSKLATKYTFIGLVLTTAGLSWMWMLTQEMVDRDFPAPSEWSFLTKVVYHAARGLEVPGANETGVVHWGIRGLAYRDLLRRLEDREGDGKGIVDIDVEGTDGIDISGMSDEWRRGYHAALMGCGRAAIELEDTMLDTTTNKLYASRYVVGPSNPRPKRLPKRFGPPPREENCIKAYAPPEMYFMKIMTTVGFTAREKMDAALAYANWCGFKGLHDTAGEMYVWALDCAVSGLEWPTASTIDRRTGIIPVDMPITDNILDATTALAVHKAQSGEPAAALPIFLSILRARRAAPLQEPATLPTKDPKQQARDTRIKRTDLDVLNDHINSFWSLLQASKFPDPPPTGNDPFVRTPDNDVDEAAVLSYVGEILFASDDAQREAGLSWTDAAVEKAWATYSSPITSRDAKIKAVEALSVATENRRKMLTLLLSSAQSSIENRRNASWWRHPFMAGEDRLREEGHKWEERRKEAGAFDNMLMRGRVYEVGEPSKPVWGTLFLREWVLPRLAGARTWEV